MEKVEGALKVRNLSKTRWVARAESDQAVKLNYKQIIESLDAFENSPLFETPTKPMASNFRIKILIDKFIVSLFFMAEVMSKTKVLTEALQMEELNIIVAMTLYSILLYQI